MHIYAAIARFFCEPRFEALAGKERGNNVTNIVRPGGALNTRYDMVMCLGTYAPRSKTSTCHHPAGPARLPNPVHADAPRP